MTEKKITVQVTCKDEATTEKYKVLADEMLKETLNKSMYFKSKLPMC